MLNLFIAEGIISGQSFFYGANEPVDSLLCKLPEVAQVPEQIAPREDDLKIAWRYKEMNTETVSVSNPPLGHNFDMSKLMDVQSHMKEKNVNIKHFGPDMRERLSTNLEGLLTSLRQFSLSKASKNVHRIVLNCLCSQLWGYSSNAHDFNQTVLKFFAVLRLLVQGTLGIVLITLPELDPGLLSRVRHYGDYVFTVHGFDGISSMNPLYEEYNGLLDVIQLPWLGGSLDLVARPATSQWAFKVKRRQFLVEHLHLPPCLSDTASRSTMPESILSGSQPKLSEKPADF
ncbi:unnamed protein product [Calicophoron daubneyi]